MTKEKMLLLKKGDMVIDVFTSKICVIKKIYKDGSIIVIHPEKYIHKFSILEHNKISEVF